MDPAVLLPVAMQHALGSLMITDVGGQILYVNPAFERCTGYAAADVLGKTPRILASGQHTRAFYRRMWATVTAGKPWKGEVVNRRKSGELYDAELVIAPVKDASGRITHYLGTHRDITREKHARTKLEDKVRELDLLNAELDDFVTRVSHGLREPLRLMSRASAGEVAELSRRLARRVQELARLARLGKDRRVFTRVELAALAGDAVRQLALVVRERRARVEVGRLPMALGNRVLVEEMLSVLLGEALAHGGKNPRVRLDADEGPDGQPGFVHLVVTDSGPTVPARDRERVFAPFFRWRGSDADGVGLALVRKVAERHGGRAWLDRAPGGGNRVHVLLPAADSPRARRGELTAASFHPLPVPAGAGGGSPLHALVVEPDPAAAERVSDALRDCAGGPATVEVVGDAAEAVARVGASSVDVVLVAPELADGDGLALVVSLVHDHPSVPVVVVAGDGDERLAVQAIQRGAEDYVTHDEVPQLLARAVTAVVERRRAAAELEQVKADAIGIVTHDLRNPVANVIGYVELLEDGKEPLTEHQRHVLSRVKENARFMLELIADILDTTRLDAGKLKLVSARHDMRELVREAVERNLFLATDKKIALETCLPAGALPLSVDRGKMLQVLNNLISNAVKYSQPGTRVQIGARALPNTVEVWVSDQGQGIAPGEVDKLFKKFSRTSTRATRGEKSTGLGLYIVSEVLRLHRGTIRVDTEPDKGSTFTFTLPAPGTQVPPA